MKILLCSLNYKSLAELESENKKLKTDIDRIKAESELILKQKSLADRELNQLKDYSQKETFRNSDFEDLKQERDNLILQLAKE